MLAYIYEDIADKGPEFFSDPETLGRLELMVRDLETDRAWGDARNVLERYQGPWVVLLDSNASLGNRAAEHRKLWARCVFLAFPSVTEAQVQEVFTHVLLSVFARYEDPRDVLDDQLTSIAYSNTVVPLLLAMLRSIQVNTELLGTRDIVRSVNKKLVPPEASWWLTEYRGGFDRATQRGAIEQAGFLAKNPNVRNLNPEEKKMLTKLIQFQDFLIFPMSYPLKRTQRMVNMVAAKIPKLARKMMEEMEERGELTAAVIDKPVTVATSVEVPPAKASPFISAPLRQGFGGQAPKQNTVLRKGGQEGVIPDPIIEIRSMAETGDLLPLLAGKPLTPANLAAALKVAYSKRAGLSDELGAREAVHVANILKRKGKPEFLQMAYFDMKEQQFKWGQ